MKPAIKYVIMGGGGLVLLLGSFVSFAALSGQPLHKIAVLNLFVKAPEETPGNESKPIEVANTGKQPEPLTQGEKPANGEGTKPVGKDDLKAVDKTVGVLGAFSLPPPFSSDELTDLQHELRSATQGAKSRLAKIEQRERDLDDRDRDLDQRQQELTVLRQKLVEKESELRMLSDEVTRDSEARNARDAASWKELAKFFEEGKPSDLAKKLLFFEPKEAVKILHALDDERASAIVNALPTTDNKYHDYLEAYRASTAKDETKKKP
jgi:flagellar motility protein MotE (MotC chaperone)